MINQHRNKEDRRLRDEQVALQRQACDREINEQQLCNKRAAFQQKAENEASNKAIAKRHDEDKRHLNDKRATLIKQCRPEFRRILCNRAAKSEARTETGSKTESETGSETKEPKISGKAG